MPGHVIFTYSFNKYLFRSSFVFVPGLGTWNISVNKNKVPALTVFIKW